MEKPRQQMTIVAGGDACFMVPVTRAVRWQQNPHGDPWLWGGRGLGLLDPQLWGEGWVTLGSRGRACKELSHKMWGSVGRGRARPQPGGGHRDTCAGANPQLLRLPWLWGSGGTGRGLGTLQREDERDEDGPWRGFEELLKLPRVAELGWEAKARGKEAPGAGRAGAALSVVTPRSSSAAAAEVPLLPKATCSSFSSGKTSLLSLKSSFCRSSLYRKHPGKATSSLSLPGALPPAAGADPWPQQGAGPPSPCPPSGPWTPCRILAPSLHVLFLPETSSSLGKELFFQAVFVQHRGNDEDGERCGGSPPVVCLTLMVIKRRL